MCSWSLTIYDSDLRTYLVRFGSSWVYIIKGCLWMTISFYLSLFIFFRVSVRSLVYYNCTSALSKSTSITTTCFYSSPIGFDMVSIYSCLCRFYTTFSFFFTFAFHMFSNFCALFISCCIFRMMIFPFSL